MLNLRVWFILLQEIAYTNLLFFETFFNIVLVIAAACMTNSLEISSSSLTLRKLSSTMRTIAPACEQEERGKPEMAVYWPESFLVQGSELSSSSAAKWLPIFT